MAYKGIGESVDALKKVTGANFDHLKATPITMEEFKAKQAANIHLVSTTFVKPANAFALDTKHSKPYWKKPEPALSPIASYKPQNATEYSKKYPLNLVKTTKKYDEVDGEWKSMAYAPGQNVPDFIVDGMKIHIGTPGAAKYHRCHPDLMDRVSQATDGNVQLQNKSIKYGQDFSYRVYCTRCFQSNNLSADQVDRIENPDDAIITFCMSHRHDGGKQGGALKVLAAFANVSYSETGASEPKVGRLFREEDDE